MTPLLKNAKRLTLQLKPAKKGDLCSSCECQDVAQHAKLQAVRIDRITGVIWFDALQVRKAAAALVAAPPIEEVDVPAEPELEPEPAFEAPAQLVDVAADEPDDEPLVVELEPEVDGDLESELGLDKTLAAALRSNGIESAAALRRFLATDGELTSLNGIGQSRANTIIKALDGAAGAV